jgi:hypothetical protein
MNENELAQKWVMLEPEQRQRRRIDARVRGWLDASESSLVAEWLGLIKVHPIVALSFSAVAACLVLVSTPLSWLAYAVL